MEALVRLLEKDFSHLTFKAATIASWSPGKKQVSYTSDGTIEAAWSLLHEVGHALLNHNSYMNDVELLQKEAEAWNKAVEVAQRYGISISENHMQSCLDTYRDWLHKRSTCPTCEYHGIQPHTGLYSCLNCKSTWKVSSRRFCRPYRLKNALK